MAKATHYITDHADFEEIVMKGDINPQMGFTVRDIENEENIVSSDMVDVLAGILPFGKED